MKQILQSRDDRAAEIKRSNGRASDTGKSEDKSRLEEQALVEALVNESGTRNFGDNPSGMYELCGEDDCTVILADGSYGHS